MNVDIHVVIRCLDMYVAGYRYDDKTGRTWLPFLTLTVLLSLMTRYFKPACTVILQSAFEDFQPVWSS